MTEKSFFYRRGCDLRYAGGFDYRRDVEGGVEVWQVEHGRFDVPFAELHPSRRPLREVSMFIGSLTARAYRCGPCVSWDITSDLYATEDGAEVCDTYAEGRASTYREAFKAIRDYFAS